MKSSFFLLLAGCFFGTVAAKTTQTDTNKPVDDGKIVLHQIFNPGTAKAEIASLKKEVEMLRKDLTQLLDKNKTKDPSWIKLNTVPVCFGAKDQQFGTFSVPSSGRLLAIKLVHSYGYVTCLKTKVEYWSHWGCGAYNSFRDHVDVVITTSSNNVLLPASQFITDGTLKWSRIPGYNSLSPELVLSVFSSPLTVTSGQVLRLWYGEDLANNGGQRDNGGASCCDVFARFL